ncbi:hypothetical protein DJ018_10700 [Phenylobacterium deserti]|uniref:Uncharacterized protein n=1 Tax=Phenylobacterium deserti TaxID=1914756 RepID=A0A328ADE2_9CAUL|nr:hypothetical protein DJ018_10700 [Phenylobacterium deserti]
MAALTLLSAGRWASAPSSLVFWTKFTLPAAVAGFRFLLAAELIPPAPQMIPAVQVGSTADLLCAKRGPWLAAYKQTFSRPALHAPAHLRQWGG